MFTLTGAPPLRVAPLLGALSTKSHGGNGVASAEMLTESPGREVTGGRAAAIQAIGQTIAIATAIHFHILTIRPRFGGPFVGVATMQLSYHAYRET